MALLLVGLAPATAGAGFDAGMGCSCVAMVVEDPDDDLREWVAAGMRDARARVDNTAMMLRGVRAFAVPVTAAVTAAVAIAAAAAAAAAQPRHEFAEAHMGMPVRIVLYADDATARSAARAAFDRIAALEDVMSDYRPASELRRLEPRAGDWVEVSEPLFDVLVRAKQIARATGGAFDPTVGPLVALWRETRRTGRLPDEAALDSARALVSWRKLELDVDRRAVRLAQAGMRLDLGGIAKGYILQDAFETLRDHGVARVLLEAGGDIVTGEAPPGRPGWRIEVAGADSAFRARAGALTGAALATSGPTRQYVEIDGTRYSHVVDPRTGRALTRDYLTHVIAPDAATADALATALGVLGPDAIPRILDGFPGATASVVATVVEPGSGRGEVRPPR